ncbi:hypothetical protein [Sediminicoccus sp. KRV36]|uniref:hypothetical protein n=1 Tax=Sediminicoccus sp. KRV36 TaxID=3133721 RepID=UPI00200CE1B6|nr:hypothetical protein [Sediminicoccus rosea]UPY38946.1 hypothetical protein LHU95_09700 [Sediminicoccus rosea]
MTLSRPIRAAMLAMMAGLSLVGCASNAYDPSLSPQQNAMRQQAGRWNATVATGALVGAAGGAALGAAVGGRNRGTAALIGAGAGALGGLLAGALVANRNLAFENQEMPLQDRIADAQARALELQRSAQAANELAADNIRRLDFLENQVRRGQISASALSAQARSMQADVDLMRQEQSGAQEFVNRLADSAKTAPQLRSEEGKARHSANSIQRSADQLENRLARVPAA